VSAVNEQLLVASRRKIALHALGAALLLAASLFTALTSPDLLDRYVLWAITGIFLFAGALIASIVRLVRPYSLRIGEDALVIQRSFRQPRRIAWADVQAFFARGTTIGIQYDRAHALTGLTMNSNAGFGKEEALLVGEFPVSPDEIAATLNEARIRAAGSRAEPT